MRKTSGSGSGRSSSGTTTTTTISSSADNFKVNSFKKKQKVSTKLDKAVVKIIGKFQ